MKKLYTSVICVFMIVLGLVLAIHYYSVYQGDSRYFGYFVFALLRFVESLLTGVSLYFHLRNVKNRAVIFIYTASVLFSIPVLFAAGIWVLYFLGIHFLPPAQR